ncbi:MAG: zf-HC2 domain-containing protein [Acidobacteriota bacterium]|nr:zf-HC2 domain-containing protein [Acidobacteriota bacterium]
MKCENLQLNLSVYLDDILTDEERTTVDEHLARCPLCRQKLADFQALRQDLRVLSRPELPNDLLTAVRSRLRQEVKSTRKSIFTEGFREWLQMRLMPYSVGTVLSLVLGVMLLWTLLSAVNFTEQNAELAKYQPIKQSTVMLTNSNSNVKTNEFELSAADFAAARLSVSGDSPSVNPQGALVALTKSFVRGKMKDDEVIVVADVFGDGLAQISEVIKPSRDLQAVRELQKALKTNPDYAPPFVPANLDQRSNTVRVVLRLQRVDVQTHTK